MYKNKINFEANIMLKAIAIKNGIIKSRKKTWFSFLRLNEKLLIFKLDKNSINFS